MIARSGPFTEPVTLDNSRVYILPTRVGLIFSLLLLFLLLGSINYTKSLGFMLTFLLAGLGHVAMLSTWRNLAGLRLSAAGASPVFAGQDAVFTVQLENPAGNPRYALAVEHDGREGEIVDARPDNITMIRFSKKTSERGYYDPRRFRLYTEFPLGLFTAWTWVDLSMQCLVYPKPGKKQPETVVITHEAGEEIGNAPGMEDFSGLRKYRKGDSWRRISWKAVARSDELYSKEFVGSRPRKQWIDWYEQVEPDTEKRISAMTRQVLDFQADGSNYGLRLPGLEIVPDNGPQHRHRCLRALAEYRPGHADGAVS